MFALHCTYITLHFKKKQTLSICNMELHCHLFIYLF